MHRFTKFCLAAFALLLLPGICAADPDYNDRACLSSIWATLELVKADSARTLQTSDDGVLKDLAKEAIALNNAHAVELKQLSEAAGGLDQAVLDASKPEPAAPSMNMDLERSYAKDSLARYQKLLALCQQAEEQSENPKVKAFASALSEALIPGEQGFKQWVDNWKPAFKGGFG